MGRHYCQSLRIKLYCVAVVSLFAGCVSLSVEMFGLLLKLCRHDWLRLLYDLWCAFFYCFFACELRLAMIFCVKISSTSFILRHSIIVQWDPHVCDSWAQQQLLPINYRLSFLKYICLVSVLGRDTSVISRKLIIWTNPIWSSRQWSHLCSLRVFAVARHWLHTDESSFMFLFVRT